MVLGDVGGRLLAPIDSREPPDLAVPRVPRASVGRRDAAGLPDRAVWQSKGMLADDPSREARVHAVRTTQQATTTARTRDGVMGVTGSASATMLCSRRARYLPSLRAGGAGVVTAARVSPGRVARRRRRSGRRAARRRVDGASSQESLSRSVRWCPWPPWSRRSSSFPEVGVYADTRATVVGEVVPAGPAWSLGIRPGDRGLRTASVARSEWIRSELACRARRALSRR